MKNLFSRIASWAIRASNFVYETNTTDDFLEITTKDGKNHKYYYNNYDTIEDLTDAIASDIGIPNTFGKKKKNGQGKFYLFNMAALQEDPYLTGSLTSSGYEEITDAEDAEKISFNNAVKAMTEWLNDCDIEYGGVRAFVKEATENGTAVREFRDDYEIYLKCFDNATDIGELPIDWE